MFIRDRWFGLNPTPVVKLQYVTPRAKAAVGFLAILVFGFVCFIAGDLHQHDQRILTYQLELPTVDILVDAGTDYDHRFIPVDETPIDEGMRKSEARSSQLAWYTTDFALGDFRHSLIGLLSSLVVSHSSFRIHVKL